MRTGRWWLVAVFCAIGAAALSCQLFLGSTTDEPVAADAGHEAGDAAAGANQEAGDAAADAPIPNSNPGIACALEYCVPGAQVCCVSACYFKTYCGVVDDAGSCSPDRGDNCGFRFRACDDSRDCVASDQAGYICCASGDNTKTASCTRMVDCLSQGYRVACDPYAPTPCPDGGRCEADSGAARCAWP